MGCIIEVGKERQVLEIEREYGIGGIICKSGST